MLLILPISYEFETTLSPKRVCKKLNGELIEQKKSVNILATGKFMKNHRDETFFYGKMTSHTDFQIFHHQARKRDGGSTGFYGKIEKTSDGSKISGHFRKPIYTYVFSAVFTLIMLFLSLVLFALEEKTGAMVFAAVWFLSFFLIFWDDKKKYLKAYLEGFPSSE